MAKGVFPEDDELHLGMPGMHGTKYANRAIYESDLILAMGVRFDDRVAGDVERAVPGVLRVKLDPPGAAEVDGVDEDQERGRVDRRIGRGSRQRRRLVTRLRRRG